jgi:hypothetical protein
MLLHRAWGKPPQLNTNVSVEYKRAIELTDQELEAIIAGAPGAERHEARRPDRAGQAARRAEPIGRIANPPNSETTIL